MGLTVAQLNRAQLETGRFHHRQTTGLDVARVYFHPATWVEPVILFASNLFESDSHSGVRH
jgi:hypothetical protein